MPKVIARKRSALETIVVSLVGKPEARPRVGAQNSRSFGRIMYIEYKGDGLVGPARIGRVTFSKTRKTLYYRGKSFQSLKGAGFKSNYFEIETGHEYWISGPKKNGQDRLYAGGPPVKIDDEAREEYWTKIRGLPERVNEQQA